MSSIQFIKATEKDIDLLVNSRIIFSNELNGKADEKVESDLRKSLTDYFKKELNKTYFSWYATVDGEFASVAGFAVREHPGGVRNVSGIWAYIMSVYTVPHHRRKGLSANILNRLIATAKDRGITAFELHATKDGEPIYIKNGFKMHNEPTYRKFIL